MIGYPLYFVFHKYRSAENTLSIVQKHKRSIHVKCVVLTFYKTSINNGIHFLSVCEQGTIKPFGVCGIRYNNLPIFISLNSVAYS